MNECKCSFAAKMQGDGCKICNPSFYVSILEEEIEELEKQIKTLLLVFKDDYSDMDEKKSCDLAKELMEYYE